jgi:hypothetical protein
MHIRNLKTKYILAAIACLLMLLAPLASESEAGQGNRGQGRTERSGAHGNNTRETMGGELSVVIVKGKITATGRNSIEMDGERFYTSGATIIDHRKRPLKGKDLYVGLKVHVVLRGGLVDRIVAYGFIPSRSVLYTDETQEEFKGLLHKQRNGR